MMKKGIFIFILILSTLSHGKSQKIRVVSSASIFMDMAKQIGKDKIESLSIVPIGGDPHLYQPRPSDAALLKSADVILVNGLTFEGWISKLIKASNTKAKTYIITKGIAPIESQKYKNATDPHAWMDVHNGLTYIDNILSALIEADPQNEDFYKKNHADYRQRLIALDSYIQTKIQSIPKEKRILITSHDAFAYYGKRYGIQNQALKGISTEAKIQSADMRRITKTIRRFDVPAIFIESTINPRVIKQIAHDTGVQIGGELYSDSIGDKDSEAPTYEAMMKHNTDIISNALSGKSIEKTKIDKDKSINPIITYSLIGLVMISIMGVIIKKLS